MSINRSLGETEMELPTHVVLAAKELVLGGFSLPAAIPKSAGFYVAAESDKTVIAFGGVEVNGVPYKIGTKK